MTSKLLSLLLALFILLFLALQSVVSDSKNQYSLYCGERMVGRDVLTNPQLFTQNRAKHFKCNICLGGDYMVLSRARTHEDSAGHTRRARELDRAFDPDLLGTNQIYNDFSGALSWNRPASEINWEDEEPYNDSHHLIHGRILQSAHAESDHSPALSAIHLSSDPPLPESDGLFMSHDGQFDSVHKLFAPANALQLSDNADWWCWRSKQECLLDVMSGFPRSCFSEKELNLTRWYAKKSGVSGQPSIKQFKNHRSNILNVAGISTNLVEGGLGNLFAINDWLKILEHEFGNPLVRKHPIHKKTMCTAFDRKSREFDTKSPENSHDVVEMLLPAVEMLLPGPTTRNSPCAQQ
ncbi:hypothetical protein K438DRAFT_813641 [Mycena galopus ATCC 62051]|nr:hypothetical protein K438DRAFT_813641 [Mycena galopus ATCC 62051]